MLFLVTVSLITVAGAVEEEESYSQWRFRHQSKVPLSFDCVMRKAAYKYGKKIIARKGTFSDLYYALNLDSEECHVVLGERKTPFFSRPVSLDDNASTSDILRILRRSVSQENDSNEGSRPLPSDAVYVSVGDDGSSIEDDGGVNKDGSRRGSEKSPFRSIQLAIDFAVQYTESKMVVLRRGVYYLETPIQLNPQFHNNLSIISYPGEHPVISGGKLLDISSWRRYKKMTTKVKSSSENDNDHNIWVTDLSGQMGDHEEFNGLQINGQRMTRARYPNLPGGIEVSCGYGCMISSDSAVWTPPQFDKYGKVAYYTDHNTSHDRPNGGWFEHYMIGVNGLCSVYDPPVSYWCSEKPSGGGAFAFRTPSGVTPKKGALPNSLHYNESAIIDQAIIFVWRPQRWANWMFEIEHFDKETGNFTFGKGGNQGARGSNEGGDFFIENVLEELDYLNEFYYDPHDKQLYLYYNGTESPPLDATFVVPQLRTLVNMTGTQWNPIQNITIDGVEFQASRYTYMDPHGVPSAGDWALERVAAIFLQGTKNIEFNNCTFDRLDGNGLMISGYNRNTTIRNSDFSFIGGTAIASWGYTNETEFDLGRPGIVLENAPMAGVDGTDGEHPRHTTVTGCTAREVGLYEKQSSFYMQAKTAETTITNNVFFNGPRAGINFNDGFGGGDTISHNLIFSTCRESGDHGPINSWDRQPFFTLGGDNNRPSMQMQWREIHHNFLIDNYSPQEDVDNDDGSAYFHTYDNFLVYGSTGMKSDFGGHDNHHFGNIYAYVRQGLSLSEQLEGHENHFYGNTVIMTGNNLGNFQCSGPAKTVIYNNSYFTATGNIQECQMPLLDWQNHGEDVGSTVRVLSSDNAIIQWAQQLLDF